MRPCGLFRYAARSLLAGAEEPAGVCQGVKPGKWDGRYISRSASVSYRLHAEPKLSRPPKPEVPL